MRWYEAVFHQESPLILLGGIVSYRWIEEKEERGERTESIIDCEHSYGIQISNIR